MTETVHTARTSAEAGALAQLPLSRRLSRLLLPLSCAVAILTAVAAPLTWFFLSYRELAVNGEAYATFLASELGSLATESPDLWK